MNRLTTLETLTTEVVLIAKLLKDFNLFYYLGSARRIDRPYSLIELLDGLDKRRWYSARFNDWILFKYNGQYCRLSLKKLDSFINSLDIKKR